MTAAKEVQKQEPYALMRCKELQQAYPFRELHADWMRWVAICSNDPRSWGDSNVEGLLFAAALQRDVIAYMQLQGPTRWESIAAFPGRDLGASRDLQDPDPIRISFNQKFVTVNGTHRLIPGDHFEVLAQRPTLPGSPTR